MSEKTSIEIEKLRRISEYYEFPFAVYFMTEEYWEKTKGNTRLKSLIKDSDKLEEIRTILNEENEV